MAKTSVIGNILEQAGETVSSAVKQEGKAVIKTAAEQMNFATSIGLNPPPDDAVIKQREDQELMGELDGFKHALSDLDKMKGNVTDEQTLDERVRREIEEKRKRLFSSLRQFRIGLKDAAENLGHNPAPSPEQERQQKEQEEHEQPMKSAHEHTSPASLENNEPILPGSKGRKTAHNRMQARILNRSKTKAERGASQSSIG